MKRQSRSRVIKTSNRQIGKSNLKRDKKLKALKPGKRISRNNKVYYELRKNRSDKKGLKIKKFKSSK